MDVSLAKNLTGSENSAFGYYSLYNNNTGDANSAFGKRALYSNSSGNNNTAFGYRAGHSSTGDNNVFIGYKAATGTGSTSYISNDETTNLITGDFSNGNTNLVSHHKHQCSLK